MRVAQDIEEIPEVHTFTEAFRYLTQNPRLFITHWNYKGAILSGAIRAPIFLLTYLAGSKGWTLALGAAGAQFAFRFLFAGVGGALIQAFRRVEPAWKAMLAVILIVPLISHVLELLVQVAFGALTETESMTSGAVLKSICMSILSALFTLYAMRQGVMIVGESDSKSFGNDIKRMPRLVGEFIVFLPNEIGDMMRERRWKSAIMSLIGFGLFSQILCMMFVNAPAKGWKLHWTIFGGKEVPILRYWFVDAILIMLFAISLSLLVRRRMRRSRLVE